MGHDDKHAATHEAGEADALGAKAIALTTHGDMVYRAAADNMLARLAPGVAGQVLLTGGPGADPYWGAGPPPGAHEATHVLGGADAIDSALDARAIALTTHGDMVYRAAAANTLARLPPGLAGQVLLSGGPGADPYWGAGPPPGAHEATHVLGGADVIDSALDARAIALANQGDIPYRAAAANTLAALAPGAAGQALLTGGPGADPYWGTPPAAADTRSRTIVVAASNSIDPTLAPAAYRCDGTADEVEINAAITALGATGGAVILLEGQYNISDQINLATGTALIGQGKGTVLRVPNGHNVNLNMIVGSGINRVLIKDLMVDGNRANQTAGTMNGIYFSTVTDSKIVHCWVEEMYGGAGIYLVSSDNNTVTGNTCRGNHYYGIRLYPTSNNNTVTGNTCQENGWHGIYVYSSSNNTVTGNTCQGNGQHGIHLASSANNNTVTGNTCQGNGYHGIYLDSSDNNTVTGNTCQGNDRHGISVDSADNNTVTGNTVVGNSQKTDSTYDGINVDAGGDYNNVQGNTVRHLGLTKQHRYGINIAAATCDGSLVTNNDFYLSGRTSNLNDAGTGTVVRDNRGWVTENNVLSPAFAIDAVAVVTVTIPHGLNVTPAVEDCQLTVVEDSDVDDWAEGYHKVESVDATNVVAKVNVTAASATGGATAKLALHVDLAGG